MSKDYFDNILWVYSPAVHGNPIVWYGHVVVCAAGPCEGNLVSHASDGAPLGKAEAAAIKAAATARKLYMVSSDKAKSVELLIIQPVQTPSTLQLFPSCQMQRIYHLNCQRWKPQAHFSMLSCLRVATDTPWICEFRDDLMFPWKSYGFCTPIDSPCDD